MPEKKSESFGDGEYKLAVGDGRADISREVEGQIQRPLLVARRTEPALFTRKGKHSELHLLRPS